MNPFAAALPIIENVLGESVGYTGGGLAQPTDIMVIWSDVAGEGFMGPGNTTRTITCEIRKTKLPERPASADRITRDGVVWKPKQVVDRDDVGAWELVLERSA